jgi:peptidoglycan hydrolase-like protein with peptidoglycan-binding domain
VTQPLAQAPAPAAAPAAPPKLPSRSAIAELIRGGEPGAITQPSPRTAPTPAAPAPAPVAPRAPTVRDPIGEMIRMGGPVPVPPANVGRSDSSDIVMSGQRALAKLGYGVKADGIMGSGTRQAIERFEQDHKLPVTGEFNARTVRELAAASGIAVP